MLRDFTYIDHNEENVIRVSDRVTASNPDWTGAHPDPGTSSAPYRIYNIGNNQPVELMRVIECLKKTIGKTALKRFLLMQVTTDVGFKPITTIDQGIQRFVAWCRDFYQQGV